MLFRSIADKIAEVVNEQIGEHIVERGDALVGDGVVVTEDRIEQIAASGWNACRKGIYELAEHTQDECKHENMTEFERGRAFEAKGFARSFGAAEASYFDHFQEAVAALIEASQG